MKLISKLGRALPLVVLATACTSAQTAKVANNDNATRSIASTKTTSAIDEATEKFEGTAQTPAPKPQAFSLNFTMADLRGGTVNFSKQVEVPLYISTSQAYTVKVDDYADRDVYDYYDCQVKVLRQGVQWTRTSNISDDWKRLNNATSNSERAKALKDAIYGVGKEYAEKLIERGYFQKAPQSWETFSREINKAGQAGILLPQHVTNTLQTSEYENRVRLGYVLSSTNGYEVRMGRCYGYIRTDRVIVGSHQETRYRNVETQTGAVQRNLTINVNGGILLPSETETIDFWVSADPSDIKITDSAHNRYQYSLQNGAMTTEYVSGLMVMKISTSINVTAIERVRTPAKSRLISDVVISDAGSRGMKVTVTMDEAIQDLLNLHTVPANFVIRYQITGCKPWAGICMNYNAVGAPGATLGTDRVQGIEIPAALLKSGTKYKAKVSLDFTSNQYYSGTTDEETSSPVKRQ